MNWIRLVWAYWVILTRPEGSGPYRIRLMARFVAVALGAKASALVQSQIGSVLTSRRARASALSRQFRAGHAARYCPNLQLGSGGAP